MKASQDWAKGVSPEFADVMAKSMAGVEDMMPTMPKDIMEAFMGKGVNPDALDVKTKLLLTLQGLAVQGGLNPTMLAEPQIKLTLRHALEAGATAQEINETIALSAMFGGAAVMTRVLEMAQAVIEKDQAK